MTQADILRHELLHESFLALNMLETVLASGEVSTDPDDEDGPSLFDSEPTLKSAADRAIEAMGALYQACGGSYRP